MVKSKFLRSRVARRIFVLFVACALAPMTVFTTLSYIQVSRQLGSQNQRQLQQTAKSLGLAIYERLTILDSDLQVAALRIQRGDPMSIGPDDSHFQTIMVGKSEGGSESNAISAITTFERTHLLSGKSLVRVDSCSTNKRVKCILIARMIDLKDPASGLIISEVSPEYLWSVDRLPANIEL